MVDRESRVAAWTMFCTLLGAKAATIALILWMHPSDFAVRFLLANNWIWLIFLGIALAIPLTGWLRMARARRRRREMLRQEWLVDGNRAKQMLREEMYR